MALTTYNITGNLEDALGAKATLGEVTFMPAGTTEDARVDGADAMLGPIRYSFADLPSPMPLTEGAWVITIRSTGRVNGDAQFRTKTIPWNMTAATTWGAIVASAAAPVPLPAPTFDESVAGVLGTGGQTDAALSATYVAQIDPSTTNKRIASRYQPVFDSSFIFEKLAPNQDGLLVWKDMNVSAGSASVAGAGGAPSYFKAVGGSVIHSGPGNLDIFWASVQHSGPREAGLFIGDLTSTGGGNNYGIHTRNIQNTLAPAQILVGYECELVPNVARGSAQYYNILVQNSGSQPVSAGLQIESPAGGGGGKFDKGINFDSSAASLTGTGIFFGGVWGAGLDLNNNAVVGVGSVTGTGATGSRFVRVADFLTLDNTRNIGFRDSAGNRQKTLAVSGTDTTQFFLAKSAGQFEFRDFADSTNLARITSSGRAEFAGGVTTKYTAGATQPGYVTNGQIEVWRDTGTSTDYLVVNVNGVSKKVALS